ncbi:hypothetical protein BLA29_013911 [Euroglyphus maynei]|uniref:Uncharacterized protein n=1 Tax=Euroglyphus maynei TaxID=6958 RepID=A0A1Y3BS41_EURMA|nr:hypothetical protein BLA29_013911 [Euroglyphus maynei]
MLRSSSASSSSNTIVTNSLRQVTIRILSPEEGFYMIAVKERNDDNESKPSNIVTVYLKSNVQIENTTALANDNSRLSGIISFFLSYIVSNNSMANRNWFKLVFFLKYFS